MEDLTLNIILELLIAQLLAGMGLVNTGILPMSLRRRNLKIGCCMWSQSLHPNVKTQSKIFAVIINP